MSAPPVVVAKQGDTATNKNKKKNQKTALQTKHQTPPRVASSPSSDSDGTLLLFIVVVRLFVLCFCFESNAPYNQMRTLGASFAMTLTTTRTT